MLSPNELSKEYITNIVKTWLEWAKPFVCTKVAEMLENIKSFSTLCHLNQLTMVGEDMNIFKIVFIIYVFITGISTTLDCDSRTNFI